MERTDLLTSSNMVKIGLVNERSSGYSGQDQWAGMPIWRYKGELLGTSITFRGTFSYLHLEGYIDSHIKTVGDLIDLIRIISKDEIDLTKLED